MMLKNYVPSGCAMNLFVRHYMRLHHDQEKDEGFEEKHTKVVSSCTIDIMLLNWWNLMKWGSSCPHIFFSCFHMSQTNVVLRVNLSVEKHASKIYTRAMFEQFGHNLYQAGAYRVEEVEKGKLYLAKHTKPHKREKWSRVVFEVKLVDDGELFECECGLFEHMGIVVCHAIKVSVIFCVFLP
jgi:hypothetical protein